MEFDTGRRRFLELAGTGTALSLAGCSALQNAESQSTTGTTSGASGGADGAQRVGLTVQPDQQKLRQRQQEIQSELSSGNVSRAEAQQQYRTAQQDLLTQAVSSFRQRAESNPNLEVVDTVETFGVVLVSGTPAALIETLSFDAVNSLLPRATFQQAKSQAQQRSGTETSSSAGTAPSGTATPSK